MTALCPPHALDLAALHATFLAHVLPRVEAHGRVYFRHVRSDRKEELLAELRGLAWKWYVRLVQRGKDVLAFVSALAVYAARAVNSGRRVCGHERKKEVLSPVAQRLQGFALEALPQATSTSHERLYASPHGQERLDAFEERLRDNTLTPVPDQAAFRLDFPAWLRTLTARERRLIRAMARGERTKDLSREFELSPGRISQLRRAFAEDWRRFCADPAEV
jgi:hypothetical protein